MDGTYLAAGMVAGEGSTHSGRGTRSKDLAEIEWSAEVDGGGVLRKL